MVENQSKIAVLGIGNLIMQDEGVGIHAIRRLEDEYEFEPDIELVDGGTSGSELYGFFESADKMIIVDAVDFKEEPGYIGTIEKDDILKRLNTKMSMHNLGLSDVLSHVKLLDIEPSEMILVGVQPVTIELSENLSEIISGRMERVLEVILTQLQKWDVKCKVHVT